MSHCLIQKSVAESDDMEKINSFSRRELTADEVYTFNVTLCNNDVDRDYEKFSVDALYEMAELFVGKTGIADHSMKSADQKARIYDTFVEKIEGKKTLDGEQFYCLKAKAYMLKNDENKNLIDEIDAGIKKEVSVSCSTSSAKCSICGAEKRNAGCGHILGRSYKGKPCFRILSGISDAYEFSFVAVPAQREAGVTKSFNAKKETINMDNMTDIIKSINSCDDDITISKSQAVELSAYIDSLKNEAELGEEYKKELTKEVVGLLSKALPDMDSELLISIASVMTTKELLGFKNGITKSKSMPKPQLATASKNTNKNNSQFRF